jgi:chlorobactene glucosyltransferase
MTAMPTFEFQEVQIIVVCILFCLAICSCVYLYRLSYRAQFSIPIIRSEQGKRFYRYKLKSKRIWSHSIIKNSTDRFQNLNLPNKKNNELKLTNTSKRISLLDNYNDLPLVSIVVPARNEQNRIERCILSLLDQDYPKFEIIVIDDNSTDATSKILKNIIESNKNKIVSSATGASTPSNMTTDRLRIITLKDKPDEWTGKTWASQKGFLESKGEILLFTDADTYYSKRDIILQAVLYLKKEKLDVLTGIPTSEKLTNFWSKITIPMWDFVSILFGVGSVADVNDPKSKIAYLMGSFFLIKRQVLVDIGTFESVREEIQEDKALGIIIKERGYKLRLVKLKNMVYTLWADDLVTLWHGIGRTVAPLVMNNKRKIILNLLIIFFGCVLPFILFPITLSISIQLSNGLFIQNIQENLSHPELYLPVLNLTIYLFVFGFALMKNSARGIPFVYTLGAPFGSGFVFVVCLYNIAMLLLFGKTRSISWQGRHYARTKGNKDLHYRIK